MTRKSVADMTLPEVVRAARARAEIEARVYDQTDLPALLRRLADVAEEMLKEIERCAE